ncbi:unnamed protein product [Caenorhabditis angaria]|uniref:Uncharacterized protein n=1 Tax=Caenorhabditis angaria TaxID=860376 RepID=A0A9P1MZN4_9PELO|nr:unnamed protein product [Caenorhabditis angaria]
MNQLCGCQIINGVVAFCDLHRFPMPDLGMIPRMYINQPMGNMFQPQGGPQIARYVFNIQDMHYHFQQAAQHYFAAQQQQPIRVNVRARAGWNQQNVVFAEGEEEEEEGVEEVEEAEGEDANGNDRVEELGEEQEQAALNDEEAEDEEEDEQPQDPAPVVVAPRRDRFDIINDILVVQEIRISKTKGTQTNRDLEDGEEGDGNVEGDQNGEDDVERPPRESSSMIPDIRAYYREIMGVNFKVDFVITDGGRVEFKYDHCVIRYGTEVVENSDRKRQIFGQLGVNPLLDHELFAMVQLTFPETRKRRVDNTPTNIVFTRVLIEEDDLE